MTECIFCDVITRARPAHVVLECRPSSRLRASYANPRNTGHVLVIPHGYPRRVGRPFPIPRREPETPLPGSLLALAAARIREALTAIRQPE